MTAPLDVTIITGLSGAGRSSAADVLEDLGCFVIDNLPPALIPKVAELARDRERPTRYALVVDVRSGEFMDELVGALAALRATGARTRMLFLDASDPALVRRFEASRRPHPLAATGRVSDGIARGARPARGAEGRSRRRRRHVEPERPRAARPPPRALRRRARSRRGAADQPPLVRLQVRDPARRRPDLRLPVPAEPALGRGPPPPARYRRGRAPLRPRAAGRADVPRTAP